MTFKFKTLTTLVVFAVSPFVAKAADAASPDDKTPKKVRHVWPLLVAEAWVPAYRINSHGFLAPVEALPYESPPANLAMRKNAKEFDKISVPTNVVGAKIDVKGDKFEMGTVLTEAPAEGSGKTGAKTSSVKPKETFKPYFDAQLFALKSIVCLYPKKKNDWRDFGYMTIPLDDVKAGEQRALVLNVSGASITVRASATARPSVIQPGDSAFIPYTKNELGVPLQAVASRNGKNETVANTSVDAEGGLLVITFLNADPKATGTTVTLLRSYIDPAAVKDDPAGPAAR